MYIIADKSHIITYYFWKITEDVTLITLDFKQTPIFKKEEAIKTLEKLKEEELFKFKIYELILTEINE